MCLSSTLSKKSIFSTSIISKDKNRYFYAHICTKKILFTFDGETNWTHSSHSAKKGFLHSAHRLALESLSLVSG